MADGHKTFGGKASEPETSRSVENSILPSPVPPALGIIPSEFRIYRLRHKTSSWAIAGRCVLRLYV